MNMIWSKIIKHYLFYLVSCFLSLSLFQYPSFWYGRKGEYNYYLVGNSNTLSRTVNGGRNKNHAYKKLSHLSGIFSFKFDKTVLAWSDYTKILTWKNVITLKLKKKSFYTYVHKYKTFLWSDIDPMA